MIIPDSDPQWARRNLACVCVLVCEHIVETCASVCVCVCVFVIRHIRGYGNGEEKTGNLESPPFIRKLKM